MPNSLQGRGEWARTTRSYVFFLFPSSRWGTEPEMRHRHRPPALSASRRPSFGRRSASTRLRSEITPSCSGLTLTTPSHCGSDPVADLTARSAFHQERGVVRSLCPSRVWIARAARLLGQPLGPPLLPLIVFYSQSRQYKML
jgi:hypothetical protein